MSFVTLLGGPRGAAPESGARTGDSGARFEHVLAAVGAALRTGVPAADVPPSDPTDADAQTLALPTVPSSPPREPVSAADAEGETHAPAVPLPPDASGAMVVPALAPASAAPDAERPEGDGDPEVSGDVGTEDAVVALPTSAVSSIDPIPLPVGETRASFVAESVGDAAGPASSIAPAPLLVAADDAPPPSGAAATAAAIDPLGAPTRAAAVTAAAPAPTVVSAASPPTATGDTETTSASLSTTGQAAAPDRSTASTAPSSTSAAAPASSASPLPAAPATPVPTIEAPSPPAQTARAVAAQVAPVVVSIAQRPTGTHQLTMTVNPDSLGPVTVRAHIGQGGDVRVELIGATDAGRDALRAIVTDLRRDLAAAMPQASLHIAQGAGSDAAADRGAQSFAGSPGEQGAGGRGAPGDSSPRSRPTTPDLTRTPTTTNTTGSGLDILA